MPLAYLFPPYNTAPAIFSNLWYNFLCNFSLIATGAFCIDWLSMPELSKCVEGLPWGLILFFFFFLRKKEECFTSTRDGTNEWKYNLSSEFIQLISFSFSGIFNFLRCSRELKKGVGGTWRWGSFFSSHLWRSLCDPWLVGSAPQVGYLANFARKVTMGMDLGCEIHWEKCTKMTIFFLY